MALFASVMFGGLLWDFQTVWLVFLGFVAFCFLSSSTYIINDILDVEKDRLHPFKRARPIASGKVSKQEALIVWFVLLLSSLVIAYSLNVVFFFIAIIYIALQFAYSYIFKSLAVFDIAFIAIGYVLRVVAGEIITGYHISVWLLLTTVSLALFLAVAKRRSELTLLKNVSSQKIEEIRKSLTHYSESLLDAFSTMFATCTLIFYAIFTYNEPIGKPNIPALLPEFLPEDLSRKWLMITIFPVVYGIMRYMQDVYEKNEGESPDRIILSDKPLLISVLIWAALTFIIINYLS